ncbi:hypothetical protein K1719_042385 [Acacia pycnantha]|nr:hypothetical protein K1719_042385 [Acacia pycnantha]
MLIGPDWAMNVEICDILNRDPTQAKDVVKGIKKKIGSKNTKVQLLALTLLGDDHKNCGDIVHMHVVERDVLHEMVRIAKKRDIAESSAEPEFPTLSGTPALSRPIELFKKGLFGQYEGASNHEELHNLIKATMMIQRLKKDVLSQLPIKRKHNFCVRY